MAMFGQYEGNFNMYWSNFVISGYIIYPFGYFLIILYVFLFSNVILIIFGIIWTKVGPMFPGQNAHRESQDI